MRSRFRRCHVGFLSTFFVGVASVLAAAQQAAPVPAHRLVIRFKEGAFEVLSRVEVSKVLPPSDALPPDTYPSGFWYELRSVNGRLLYRKIIEDPCRIRYEGPAGGVFDGGTAMTLERREVVLSERTFSLLVPRAVPGDQLVLVESPHEQERQDEPAVEVARLTLIRPIE
jgi:hypothetical protein